MNNGKNKNFFWKGKRVSEKVYYNRLRLQKVGKNLRQVYGSAKEVVHNLKHSECAKIEGRRIIHLNTLGEQLFCSKCKSILSILDSVQEQRFGLASIFHVKCRTCGMLNQVSTDKKHSTTNSIQAEDCESSTNKRLDIVVGHCNASVEECARPNWRKHYDTNTKAVIGVLNGGMGNTHLNKLLASLNIPPLHWKVFKNHEVEVGAVAEYMAKESCEEAALQEKSLTFENYERVKELL
ncbi:uncharacterized protein [Venturia canescens]|uniref:uncharacterized protein isoform X2 n=1 Tax=Venturia canescens TaxID=32260 RepID=UPI001C9CE802|nr:uncharacterized protein LOC122411804 isoform X2 [Venturia canescens]